MKNILVPLTSLLGTDGSLKKNRVPMINLNPLSNYFQKDGLINQAIPLQSQNQPYLPSSKNPQLLSLRSNNRLSLLQLLKKLKRNKIKKLLPQHQFSNNKLL